ncbi:amidase [Elioraea sp.]|uniref:amidase n=1 Tax=Elioraea sp. TaxID=2185103 RepID=UPI0025C31126|nr:amidase [Elioraea sp.]
MDLPADSATALLHAFRRGTLSPVEATSAALARIRAFEPAVNAFVLVDEVGAMQAARQSEERWRAGRPLGVLDGVPSTIKDATLTRGWPTLRGSRTIARDQPWNDDAPVVARMREAGAVLLGKTTLPEFAWKGVCDSALTGTTRNPWDVRTTPGGSSGGAAVAAALGMGWLHQGSDGGGSIRIPAGFTGVVGHKPSFGRVPLWPPTVQGTLSHTGPITRTVADAALMLTAIARPDARDWMALPHDARDWRMGLSDGVRGWRIAASATLGYVRGLDDEVAAAFADAVSAFEALGATVEGVAPGFADPHDAFRILWYAGAAQNLRPMAPDLRALVDPGLREIAEEAERFSASDLIEAGMVRARMGVSMKALHERYDVLLTPTLPIPAFMAGQEVPDPARQTRWTEWSPYCFPFNMTMQPAISVPCGLTRAGLPIGLQIVGPAHDDALVLRAAAAFEAARPFARIDAPRGSAA